MNDVAHQPKTELAREMILRTKTGRRHPSRWVTGDAVYGRAIACAPVWRSRNQPYVPGGQW